MRLHKFNPKIAKLKLKLSQNREKYLKVGTLIFSVVILIIGILYFAYAKFSTTNKFKVVQTTVGNFTTGDYTLAAYVDGTKSDNFPEKNGGYVVSNIECNNNASASWNHENWGIYINGVTKSGTKCNVYFIKGTLTETLLAKAGTRNGITAKGVPDFSKIATTEDGMYAANDDYGTSYYYRGAVTNNNVLFGGYCWKVIRISGNDTTRMIYNGAPSSGQCTATGDAIQINTSAFNTTYNDNAYVGYMYGIAGSSTYDATHTNTNSSTIKTLIDSWYNINLSSYAEKISDTEFCNDRSLSSGTGIGTTNTEYEASNRLYSNNSPILTCPNKHDRFTVDDTTVGNGDLTYPIGLITADEVTAAGGKWNTSNSSYYLYSGSKYWTMSSFQYNSPYAHEFVVYSNGSFANYNVDYSANGIRPVINLNANVYFSSGDGTSATPYIIN
jgi:energy-converting hydrogenase Eha subunit B